jgi:hypothetical protein
MPHHVHAAAGENWLKNFLAIGGAKQIGIDLAQVGNRGPGATQQREPPVNFIEQTLHLSPDGGSGSLEVLLLLAAILFSFRLHLWFRRKTPIIRD